MYGIRSCLGRYKSMTSAHCSDTSKTLQIGNKNQFGTGAKVQASVGNSNNFGARCEVLADVIVSDFCVVGAPTSSNQL